MTVEDDETFINGERLGEGEGSRVGDLYHHHESIARLTCVSEAQLGAGDVEQGGGSAAHNGVRECVTDIAVHRRQEAHDLVGR